jgi:hypothetical protein
MIAKKLIKLSWTYKSYFYQMEIIPALNIMSIVKIILNFLSKWYIVYIVLKY